ncbi:tRNA-uridine aminocarboxypropyltransferase [Thalassotalea euphylliae]|uniref:tRNA-uridine aminocarboxypropyltransferase n=1 Tax=Thalassotalea euphylliae TaxID=1655234 RepID=UPI0036382141
MTRDICAQCQRPPRACICQFMTNIDNQCTLVILQHPKEQNHPKGSAPLLQGSLSNTITFIAENFDKNEAFISWLASHKAQTALLYPSDNAQELTLGKADSKPITNLIVVDATWRKAFKMYQISSALQNLPAVTLPKGLQGNYAIRKTKKENALSTLEACCYALSVIEQNENKYHSLLKSFAQFNAFQLSFRPSLQE